eukprot:119696_1
MTMMLLCVLSIILDFAHSNTITCDGYYSCFNVTQTCTDGEDCYINCYGKYACFRSAFVCPIGPYNCIIDVTQTSAQSQYSLFVSTINATQMDGGNLTVTCYGSAWTCAENTFNCPRDGNCMFIGMVAWTLPGSNAFSYSSFNAHPTTALLSIAAKGSHALSHATVRCPYLQVGGLEKNCLIHLYGSGPEMITDLRIYAFESFKCVSLTCNHSSTNDNCYSYPNTVYTDPIMTCGYDTCRITLDNIDPGCVDNTSKCHDFTFEPTAYPTTKSPTATPSTTPTASPSTTAIPTAMPSSMSMGNSRGNLHCIDLMSVFIVFCFFLMTL